LPAKAVITAGKMHEHPRRHRTKIMQCFRSSRVYGTFFADKTKRAAHWNCPSLGLLRGWWPKTLCLDGERRKKHQDRSEPPEFER